MCNLLTYSCSLPMEQSVSTMLHHVNSVLLPFSLFLFVYSSSFLVEHRSSTRTCHLTLFCAVPFVIPRKKFTFQLCHSLMSPGVSLPPLSLPLWVPLQCPVDYMSIWSPRHVANPTPSLLSLVIFSVHEDKF